MSSTNPISSELREASLSAPTEFSSSLGRALFQQKLESILIGTQEATGADGVAVSLKEGNGYVCRVSVGCAPEIGVTVEPGQGLCGRCVVEARIIVEQELDGEIKSVAAVPVLKGESVHGFVAAFSQRTRAFTPAALGDLERLAAVIHNEIDPPLSYDLKPEAEEADDDLLTQLEIDVPSTKTPGNFQEDDESFLTELVRDVLQEAPSSGALTAEAVAEKPKENAGTEKAKQPFQSRTTEEVLMQVVDHSSQKKRVHTAAAAAPAPALTAVPNKEVTSAPARKPVWVQPKPIAVVPKPIAVPESKPDEPVAEPEVGIVSPAWVRPALIATALLLLTIGAIWLGLRYYRGRSATQPQKVLASAPDKGPAATDTNALASQPTSTEKSSESQPSAATTQLKSTKSSPKHESAPLIVASSERPRSKGVNEEPPPAALSGTTSKLTVPDLPAASANVVFGGAKSTGAIPAKLIQRVNPTYPLMARSMHLSGEVHLEATVGTDGRVKSVRAVDGHQVLADAAADAVRRWRYQPASQNGTNVESVVDVTIRFR